MRLRNEHHFIKCLPYDKGVYLNSYSVLDRGLHTPNRMAPSSDWDDVCMVQAWPGILHPRCHHIPAPLVSISTVLQTGDPRKLVSCLGAHEAARRDNISGCDRGLIYDLVCCQ